MLKQMLSTDAALEVIGAARARARPMVDTKVANLAFSGLNVVLEVVICGILCELVKIEV